jgi:hypothetical protein
MFYGESPILGVMSNNLAITLLHVAIAGVALVLGFGVHSPRPAGAGA